MPKASPLQESFLGGEISPFVYGRVGSDRYKESLALCQNYIPLLQGPLIRRPGTTFVCEVKDSTKETIVRRFKFSQTQAYVLEIGNLYVRFIADHGQIVEAAKTITGITKANPAVVTSNGHGFSNGDEVVIDSVVGMTQVNERNFKVANVTANTFSLQYMNGNAVNSTAFTTYTSGGTASRVYEVTTPYLEADLRKLDFVQSADVVYIVHQSYAPRKLTRLTASTFSLSTINFLDGPYLPLDTSGITLTPSNSTSLTPNITASSALFASTDVGRLIRVFTSSVWHWFKITAFTSTTVVTVVRLEAGAIGTAAISSWRLGIYSDTTGYPACVTFHEDRLVFGGPRANAQRFDMSVSGDYENFAPSATDGSVPDDRAVSRSLNANDVQNIFWMSSDERALLAGTLGGEWAIRPSVQSEAISPSNINAKQAGVYGSAQMKPVVAGKSTIYVQSTTRTIRELSYFYNEDGFLPLDRSVLADHITGKDGVLEIAHQKDKPSIVWAPRADGILAGMTYEREEDSLIVSWHQHIFGGVSDVGGTHALAKSVAIIPSSDGKTEEAYFVVERWLNGERKKYIDYLTKLFEHEDDQRDAFFVDSGLSFDNPIAITGATSANPVVITAAAHGFANGDDVLISGILGDDTDDVDGMDTLNDRTFVVRNKTPNTFELEDVSGDPVNGTGLAAYTIGGEVRKYVTTIQGLWHLEGESVAILGDGGVQPSRTVTNGAITLQNRATTIHVGLSYRSRGETLEFNMGGADGTSVGKTRRINHVSFRLYRTLGFKYGPDFDNLQEMVFRTNDDPDGRAPALFSGIKSQEFGGDYEFQGRVCWEQSGPTPGTVLSVAPQQTVEDRG